jgi:integrase
MLRFPDRPGALPLSLIWNFETTSNTKSINKAKVKYFRFHALRHFGASMLDSANVPIGSIQRILSHENRSTTENYLHSIGDSERQAMDVLNAQFENFSHTNSHTNKKGLQS